MNRTPEYGRADPGPDQRNSPPRSAARRAFSWPADVTQRDVVSRATGSVPHPLWIDAAIKLMDRTGPCELVDRVPLAHPDRERGARAMRDLKLVDGDIPVTQLGDRAGVVLHLVHQDRVGALQVTRQQNRWAWLTDTQTRHGGSHGADFPGQLRTHRLDIAQNLAVDISRGYVDVVQRTKHGPSPRQVRTHAGFGGKA